MEIPSPQENRLYLMFPWADADLLQFWQGRKAANFSSSPQNSTLECSRWVARQCFGLAQALNQLHQLPPKDALKNPGSDVDSGSTAVTEQDRLYGVHGDIKPQNILWYKRFGSYEDPMGLLQLADFGTGEIHRYISKSDFPRKDVQGTYRPPEFDLFQRLTRSIDIWSLGCVFLEFLTWLVKGWKDREFASKREAFNLKVNMSEDTFYEIKSLGQKTIAQVHHGVTEVCKQQLSIPSHLLQNMKADLACTSGSQISVSIPSVPNTCMTFCISYQTGCW